MPTPEAWIITAAVAAVGGAIFAARAFETRRIAELETFCQMRGFTLSREQQPAAETLEAVSPEFRRGRRRRRRVSITGQLNGRPFTAFEHTYVVSSGKSHQTHTLRVIEWQSDDAAFPRFRCTPEGFWNRLGQRFGVQDIDFPEDAAFSDAYQLQGDDEAAVRALLTPKIRSWLAANHGHCLAGQGKRLVWWQTGRLPKPDDLDAFFAAGDGVRRLFLK